MTTGLHLPARLGDLTHCLLNRGASCFERKRYSKVVLFLCLVHRSGLLLSLVYHEERITNIAHCHCSHFLLLLAAMNAFLRAHSQKFAAAAFAGAALLSYTAQPHVEVFTRWQHMKTLAGGQEMRPSPRILEIANRVIILN